MKKLGYSLLIPFGVDKATAVDYAEDLHMATGYNIWVVKETRHNKNWKRDKDE